VTPQLCPKGSVSTVNVGTQATLKAGTSLPAYRVRQTINGLNARISRLTNKLSAKTVTSQGQQCSPEAIAQQVKCNLDSKDILDLGEENRIVLDRMKSMRTL
jgi:hypothetical protein